MNIKLKKRVNQVKKSQNKMMENLLPSLKQEAIDIIKVLSNSIINKISPVDAEMLIECLT